MRTKIFIFLLLVVAAGFGQQLSAKPHYQSLPNVTIRVDSLNELAAILVRINPDSALLLIDRALLLSRNEDYQKGLARALFLQGNYYQNRGQHELSYRAFYESIQIDEILGDKKSMAECYNSIGDIFRRQRNYTEASVNYTLSIDLALSIGDSVLISENMNNFGDILRDQRDYNSAIIRYEEALEIDLRINNGYGITDGYNNLGDVYLYLEDYDQAISYFNRALRLAESMNNQLEVADNLNKLGRSYAAQNDLETALFYSRLAATVSERIRLTEELMEAHYSLTSVYQKLGRFDKALESHMLYTKFQDSLLDVRSVRKISELQFLFETEKKDSEILLKEAELETQSVQLKWLITAVILLVILALVLYKNYLTKQLVNKQLIAQQQEIQKQTERLEEKNRQLKIINEEKNEIIGMVAHDLRAPINQVMSVVSLMQYEEKSFSSDMLSYLEIMGKAADRMKFMVSEILDAEAIESSTFNLTIEKVNLCEIIEEERKHYSLYADKKKLKLVAEVNGSCICAMVDKNIYRNIIENLLSNAVKYSPEGRNIKIKLKVKDNKVITSVKDEGPGLSEEDMKLVFGRYQRLSAQPTGGEVSLGLGLSLVKKFTEAMEGEVWCESTKGKGAEFFVSFEECNS